MLSILLSTCLLSLSVTPPSGSVLFFSATGLHQVGSDGSGFRTILAWDRNDNEAVKGQSFPPTVGGLCVDDENMMAFWTVNYPDPITHTVHAIDIRPTTMNPVPVELASSAKEEYLGCAVDPTSKTLYYFSGFTSSLGIKLMGMQYTGPDSITATAMGSPPGIKIGLFREGGGVAVSGGTAYLSLREKTGTCGVYSWAPGGGTSFTEEAGVDAILWPDGYFFSHLQTDVDGTILALLSNDAAAAATRPTTLYRYDPDPSAAVPIRIVWKNTMIPPPVALTTIGALQGGFSTTTTQNLIYLAAESPWTPGATPAWSPPTTIYLTDVTSPDTPQTIYTPPGGPTDAMIGEFGLGPISFLSVPLPPMEPPVEPPVSPPITPPVSPPEATPVLTPDLFLIPVLPPFEDTTSPDTPSPGAAGMVPVEETDAPTPGGGVQLPPVGATPLDVNCTEVNAIDCAGMYECDYDYLSKVCTAVNCPIRGENECELAPSCVWDKTTGCIIGPNCAAEVTPQECDIKLPSCVWDGNAQLCRQADKISDEPNEIDKVVLLVLIGVLAVLVCGCCLLCIACRLGKKKEKVTEESEKMMQTGSPKSSPEEFKELRDAKRACRAVDKVVYEPPEIAREMVYGKKVESESEEEEEQGSAVLKMPEVGGWDRSDTHVEVGEGVVEAGETEQEKVLKMKIREAQANLLETKKHITTIKEQEAAAIRRHNEERIVSHSPGPPSSPPTPPSNPLGVKQVTLAPTPNKVAEPSTAPSTTRAPPQSQERHQSHGIMKELETLSYVRKRPTLEV